MERVAELQTRDDLFRDIIPSIRAALIEKPTATAEPRARGGVDG